MASITLTKSSKDVLRTFVEHQMNNNPVWKMLQRLEKKSTEDFEEQEIDDIEKYLAVEYDRHPEECQAVVDALRANDEPGFIDKLTDLISVSGETPEEVPSDALVSVEGAEASPE